MKQSRLMSLVEAVTNVIVGYGVAVVTQVLIFPIFGLHATLAQNLMIRSAKIGHASQRPCHLQKTLDQRASPVNTMDAQFATRGVSYEKTSFSK